MGKKVFIIGNGFDLDLGWKTSYKDFAASDFWPVHAAQHACPMEEYLSKKVDVERWYDLESILREYAADDRSSHIKAHPKDEPFFNELRDSLTNYIRQEETHPINTESLAVRVLEAIVSNGYFSSVYTFNYTDLSKIAEKVGINKRFDFKYVHGNVRDDSIILGVDDHSELREGYGYLRKVFSEYYKSNHIRYDLQECNEVVFFGHSLGDMDYPYFRDFFFTQSHCSSRKDGKKITIITKDNRSRIQLLEQLRIMNEGQMEPLRNDNIFNIIMTAAPDKGQLESFFSHLKQDSVDTHDKQIAQIESMFRQNK